ncbi:hypothetical protein MUP77_14880 [Candidatus Bathyarchaeota archaeon]|nr:hypothetical protein [Candidatus Bathyarchaeota archaeon]
MEKENKIEIVENPIKKIVILSSAQISLEEFFKRAELFAMAGQPITLSWAEGIVFLAVPFQSDSDIIIEETLKGTQYLSSVLFASMPKYESIKKVGGLREIPIVDQTSISEMRQIAQWLQKKIKQN